MLDPNFSGTLTYICEHNEQGAMGIVINRPTELSLMDLLEQLEIASIVHDETIYVGGPVQQDRGFILHRFDEECSQLEYESTLDVTSQIRLTTSKDILKAISEGTGPQDFLIALGYAGWGEGQLEQELAENTWLCCPASADILFCPKNEKKMTLAMGQLGIDTNQLNGQIGHA